ncbi:MAG TPA: CocE/NonD family hydrolase [Thermoanaerobaculia bacterium]|nr:CocE/NonD family hydrolase [Thermoanaerobaculia bacterium]
MPTSPLLSPSSSFRRPLRRVTAVAPFPPLLAALLLLLAAGLLPAQEPAEAPEIAAGATEHMVAMRDGVRLATNVFVPEGEGPWPTIVTRTPYGKDGRFGARSSSYTEAGYAFVVQDTRGKFRSEGEYRPFETDREDGYDTVEWIAAQPWSNGKVGISGASAMGITSNYAAAANPPHLVAAFVVVAPHSMMNESTFIGGIFKEADVGNWMRRQGAGDQVAERKRTVLLDDYWLGRDLPFLLDQVDVPIYNLGGWYDLFSNGNVSNFVYLQTRGAEGARSNQKLFMGPFGHGQLAGDLEYPNGSGLMESFERELRWFDHWLKGIDNGIMDEPAVEYYLMAAARKGSPSPKNGYRTLDAWPPPSEKVSYYLTPSKKLSTTLPPANDASTTYTSDPANPAPTVGGANLTLPIGPRDQREIEERQDYLRFETAQLTEDVTVAGRVTVELWVSTDAPDTDFMVKLVDVYPDGYEALLLDGALRARYRHGRRPQDVAMMEPGKPEKLTIDLWSTANVFEKGHRIALHVTSSNFPRFEVNPNTGHSPGTEESDPQVAENTIYHDAAHPSALILPVLVEASSGAVTSSAGSR